MGYQVYKVGNRFGGYGVPAICEHPDCNEEIDRGMSYACGGEPFSELGCDKYFCHKHMQFHSFNTGGGRTFIEVCERCAKKKSPFPYKQETEKWMKFQLKDKSWRKWRNENPWKVKEYKLLLKSNETKSQ